MFEGNNFLVAGDLEYKDFEVFDTAAYCYNIRDLHSTWIFRKGIEISDGCEKV